MKINILYKPIRYVLISCCFLIFGQIHGQILSIQDQIAIELEKRGLTVEEVEIALYEAGYDLDNIDPETISNSEIEEIRTIILKLEQSKILNSYIPTDTLPYSQDSILDLNKIVTEKNIESQDSIIFDTIDFNNVFGHHLYASRHFDVLESTDDAIAPTGYVVGPGDVLIVSIFGDNAQMENEYSIRDDGYIYVNNDRQKVYLSGLTISQARDKLIRIFRKFVVFKSDNFGLHLRAGRVVNVQILGEVNVPGIYIISSLNSVFNAVVAASGPTSEASLRSVRLIRSSGQIHTFDLYEWIVNPGKFVAQYLNDGDIIHVPVSDKRVEIIGEVKRPMKYDMKQGEGVKLLIDYAGGLNADAYLNNFNMIRVDGEKRLALDIPYSDLLVQNGSFILENGDYIIVSKVSDEIENYVRVTGEVRNQGDFERTNGMRVLDLIRKANLKESSKTDVAYLLRSTDNGNVAMKKINIDLILKDPNSPFNFYLENKDEIVIYDKSRFIDFEYVIIGGAVRYPDTLVHDASNTLKITDYITQAGGLTKEAASFAHIRRVNVHNPTEIEYIRVDLDRAFNSPEAVDNIALLPFDSVYVYFESDFRELQSIRISGAVNLPGEIPYGEDMTLQDAIIMAGGFKLASATNDIEVSRVLIRDNQPTKTIIEKVRVSRNMDSLSRAANQFILYPFDNIFVREVPEFELQVNVNIVGEVKLPGLYSLIKSNETVLDLVHRAGGLTDESFAAGAQLYRVEDSLGFVVMRLDEVLLNPKSIYNYNLKNGDIITIPKKKDYVTIRGATRAVEAVGAANLGPNNEINVPYHEGKNAKFYIEYYAGGFAPQADKKKVFVSHPNGEVRQLNKKLFASRKFPKVRKGSIITIGFKEQPTLAEKKDKEVNWTKVLGDSIGQAMSILTLILLIERLD